MITEIVRHRYWLHTSGRQASFYGSAPFLSEADRAEWQLVEKGWTWKRKDGCIGLGRRPAATRAEAQQVMDSVNARCA